MDIKSGNNYPSSALSNFAPHKFMFRGVLCFSMEGLLQSFKFKNPEMQKEICKLIGRIAKLKGSNKNWKTTQTLWWNGKAIKRNSQEYQDLLDEAYESLVRDSEAFKKALLSTQDAILTHSIGKTKKNDTVLTTSEFCSRLMTLRQRLYLETRGIK